MIVSDQSRRPAPGPRPSNEPLNYVVDRRKVLFGLGFGAMTAAGVRHLDQSSIDGETASEVLSGSQEAVDASSSPVTSTPEPASFAEPPATGEPFAAPVLDESKRLAPGQVADVVFNGGRIVDPETGFDRIANIALVGGTIAEISDQPIAANREVQVSGNVVSPGFIDILSYEPNDYGEWWKVADGVTSNLGMHGLRFDAAEFYDEWRNFGVPINFGGAVHNSEIREQAGLTIFDSADENGIIDISRQVEAQVNAGFLGIHVQPEYAPGVSPTELNDMGVLAERLGVPLCVHARFSDNQSPGVQSEATLELIEVARNTGCHVHIEHINSTGGTGRMAEALGEIESALAEGLRMTTCMYPYAFWATFLNATRFDDWQEKYGITFSDLQVAGTNERLTESTFGAAKDANALTAAYAIPSADLDLAIQAPFMMIGSDAILERPHNNHPRSTGCFARTIGTYSRDRGLIDLPTALAMMTIRPANLLSISSPQMDLKGRLQIGADADITIFDPLTIRDTSTIENPAQESLGVEYVYVNGVEVRNPEGNVMTAKPGVAITSTRA